MSAVYDVVYIDDDSLVYETISEYLQRYFNNNEKIRFTPFKLRSELMEFLDRSDTDFLIAIVRPLPFSVLMLKSTLSTSCLIKKVTNPMGGSRLLIILSGWWPIR